MIESCGTFLNESYTPHMHSTVKRAVFFLTSIMKKELTRALKSAPKQKAAGPDGIFAEMLQINEEISLSLLLAIAFKIGEFVRFPFEWDEALIVTAVQKRGPRRSRKL